MRGGVHDFVGAVVFALVTGAWPARGTAANDTTTVTSAKARIEARHRRLI
jgi:hypothetical protein